MKCIRKLRQKKTHHYNNRRHLKPIFHTIPGGWKHILGLYSNQHQLFRFIYLKLFVQTIQIYLIEVLIIDVRQMIEINLQI